MGRYVCAWSIYTRSFHMAICKVSGRYEEIHLENTRNVTVLMCSIQKLLKVLSTQRELRKLQILDEGVFFKT